jgi:Holliday junction DNA helicase RuvA
VIGRLRGVVAERGDDGSCVIDAGGVGYEVFVPLGTLGRLPLAPEPVTLHVHTHVREDAFVLYGFATLEDRAAFRTLLTVAGIGPKIAIGILSVLDARDLAAAVQRGDTARLRGIPGVGKKTTERLVLELKDKLPLGGSNGSAVVTPIRSGRSATWAPDQPLGLVNSALINLGFKPAEADRAVSAIAPHADGKAIEMLLREALSTLA